MTQKNNIPKKREISLMLSDEDYAYLEYILRTFNSYDIEDGTIIKPKKLPRKEKYGRKWIRYSDKMWYEADPF